ncbi:TonB-dependent siderophore receptor [Pseudomonas sp. NPDC007930]|uniref:TonB-dependent siderophore receptor n=1 Tax=Pseudomonas sp. NPDC007930 TaxID=3364417 RepID=UPI0036ED0DB2
MNHPLRLRALPLALACSLAPGAFSGALLFAPALASAADNTRYYAIPAGSLLGALNQFGHQANLMLAYPAQQAAGRESPGLQGDYTVEQGLALLLSGTGLQALRLSNGSYTLQTAPEGPLTLPTSTINGSTEQSLSEPVEGIVANRSSVGTKTNSALNEVPQSISVITRDEMNKRGVQDFNSAVAYTPGIRAIDYVGGQGAPDIYMRGFRAFNLFGLYKDGLRTGFNQYDTDFETFALERIDVIKGPASVLYGQMAPGGMVNLSSKRPTSDPVHEVQVQAGNHGRRQEAIDLGGQLDDEGKLAYRFVALQRDSGTQVDHSPDDRTYVAPSLAWKPDDATTFTLLASYLKTRKGGAEQSFPVSGTLNGTALGHVPASTYLGDPRASHYDVENTSLGYLFERQLSEHWTFAQNARYMAADVDYVSNGARNSAQLGSDGRTYTFGYQKRPKKTDTFLLDNNLQGQFDTGPVNHQVLFGLDYGHYSGRESRRGSNNQTVDIFDPVYNANVVWNAAKSTDGKSVIVQQGAYFQDQLKLDNWRLTLGGRQDWLQDREYSYLGSGGRSAQNDHKFTGRAGLAYLFDNGVTPYASYSTSFQPTSGTAQDGSTFKPTEGEQYELGVKYQPPGHDSFITASVYELTQKNVTTTDPTNSSFQVQTGEQRSRGLELEGKAALTANLDVIAAYSYTDAEVTQANTVGSGTTAYSLKGNRPIAVAKNSGSLWLDYSIDQGLFDGLQVGAGQRYVGASYNAKNTVKVPGYSLTDASLRYDLGKLDASLAGARVELNVNNLFDKTYFTPGFYEYSVFYGTRRTVMGTLAYTW